MLYKNLRAEMSRRGVTVKDLAELIGVRHATVSDKLHGKSRFFFDEAEKIRDSFFPDCSLEYLFQRNNEDIA